MRHIPLLLIGLLVGCSGGAPHGSVTRFDTLASGALVATSGTEGAWAAGLEGEWTPELVARIGGFNSQEDPYLFSSVRGVVVGSENQIYVLEAQSCEVRVFDLQGGHLRSMGGCGQGPGELLRPVELYLSPQGELWIADPGNGRFQLFDPSGVALRTYPLTGGGSASALVGGFDSDGFFRRRVNSPDGSTLHRIDPATGISLDSLPLPPDQTDRFILRRMEGGQLTGIGIYSIPFALDRQWGFWDNTLWTADGDSFEMVGLSMSEGLDTTLVVRRELPRAPIEEAELEEYWETMNLTPSEVRQLDLSKIPDTKRSFERFFVDRDGYLWASRWVPGVFGSRQSAVRPYDVFSRDGRFLGTLPLEMKPSPTPWVEGDLLVGVHADEMDVPVVVVYRLTGRPSGD